MVRMPGFGLDGPWRDLAAFAFVIEDASGLTWLTGHPDLLPFEPYCVGDPNAGLHALFGLLVALEHRDRTGEGGLVEAAMVDAGAQRRRRAGDRVLGLRRAAGPRREPRPDRGAAEPLPAPRRPTKTAATTRWVAHRRRHGRAVGVAARRRSAIRRGPPIRPWRTRERAAGTHDEIDAHAAGVVPGQVGRRDRRVACGTPASRWRR